MSVITLGVTFTCEATRQRSKTKMWDWNEQVVPLGNSQEGIHTDGIAGVLNRKWKLLL